MEPYSILGSSFSCFLPRFYPTGQFISFLPTRDGLRRREKGTKRYKWKALKLDGEHSSCTQNFIRAHRIPTDESILMQGGVHMSSVDSYSCPNGKYKAPAATATSDIYICTFFVVRQITSGKWVIQTDEKVSNIGA